MIQGLPIWSFFVFALIVLLSCRPDLPICLNTGIVPYPPYQNPVWHPSGRLIGFNRQPIKTVIMGQNDTRCQAAPVDFEYEDDSIGFWLINEDGTSMRRALPYMISTPTWSPDGNWIFFERYSQIYRMPFDGINFDSMGIEQLTFDGQNSFPAVSRDGNRFSYTQSNCSLSIVCGVWINFADRDDAKIVGAYGGYPTWHPKNDSLLFKTVALSQSGEIIGDSLWIYSLSTGKKSLLQFFGLPSRDVTSLRYSPSGLTIGYIATNTSQQGNHLFIADFYGKNSKELSTEWINNFCWSPDGSMLVYQRDPHSLGDPNDGTLWIVDSDGTHQRQLTFNSFVVSRN